MNIEKEKEQETLKYLSAMKIIDFNQLGFVYGKETITDTLVLLKNKDIEIEMLKKDNKKKDYAYEDLQTAICEVCGTEDCPQDCNVCLKKYKSELEKKEAVINEIEDLCIRKSDDEGEEYGGIIIWNFAHKIMDITKKVEGK